MTIRILKGHKGNPIFSPQQERRYMTPTETQGNVDNTVDNRRRWIIMVTRQGGHNLLNKNAQKRICIKMKAMDFMVR